VVDYQTVDYRVFTSSDILEQVFKIFEYSVRLWYMAVFLSKTKPSKTYDYLIN